MATDKFDRRTFELLLERHAEAAKAGGVLYQAEVNAIKRVLWPGGEKGADDDGQ